MGWNGIAGVLRSYTKQYSTDRAWVLTRPALHFVKAGCWAKKGRYT